MGECTITAVDTVTLSSILKEMGWPSSLPGGEGAPQIVSSVNGVNFNICFGTKATAEKGWTDFTISAPFSFEQEISPVVVPFWNRRNRFARVYRTDRRLFLDMDIFVSGGVSEAHLKYQFGVWAEIARMFLHHLRADQAVLERYNAAGNGALARSVDRAGTRAPATSPETPSLDGSTAAQRGTPADLAMQDVNEENSEQDIKPA